MGKRDGNLDDKFSIKCDKYAETCRLELIHQHCTTDDTIPHVELDDDETTVSSQDDKVEPGDNKLSLLEAVERSEKADTTDTIPAQKSGVTAQKPRFERRLIPVVTAVFSATGQSDAVYPRNTKMAVALGVEPFDRELSAPTLEGTSTLCNSALKYLLKQTSELRAKYALEFEGLLVKQMNSRFKTVKSLLRTACEKSPGDA